jgi:hypothetical protein
MLPFAFCLLPLPTALYRCHSKEEEEKKEEEQE